MSICREFMEAQGGSISVKSEYGTGAEFVLKCQVAV
ncbi:MAG: ATP-binding protein [Chitinophagaceae bacterium]|nr:ATP-binding protein [Chitinophagaceae bacterium]